MSSSSDRSAVTPMPAATSRAWGRCCAYLVKAPYGPSTATLVPGRSAATAAEWSPTALTVSRT